jgi:thiazole tautomerase (transcriptional regulator TenI)
MVAIPVIHAVTTDDIVAGDDFIPLAIAVMRAFGPRGAVHLRASDLGGRRLFEIATQLAAHQEATGAWLVVNDRIDVALSARARAVQLTTRSLSVSDARQAIRAAAAQVPGLAIGASVHTVDDARAAISTEASGSMDEGPTWLVAGHVFATPSHAGQPARGMSLLSEICAAVPVPVIAIGGVQPADVQDVLAAGAYGVAAIRGIWRAVDAERAAGDYLSAYDALRDARAVGRGGSGDRS